MDWRERLKKATTVSERLALAKEENADPNLLKTFIEFDVEPSIVIAAALNVNCPDELLSIAADRAGWRVDLLVKRKRDILKEYFDNKNTNEGKFSFSDRDAFLVNHILKKDNKHADIHLGDYSVRPRKTKIIQENENVSYKEHVVLIICPSWGIIFPPYNIAKITGLLRSQGYKVTVYDLNIESYHILKEKTGVDFWSSEKYHLWFEDRFETMIFPHLKNYINDIIEEIIQINPSIVGFSLYNTNMWCSRAVMQMIRDIMPNTTIAVGGPEASQDKILHIVRDGVINYIFKGEAEETFLSFLEQKEYTPTANKVVIGDLESKIALDELPFPDYSDYDLDYYLHPDGVSIETSRGCVAQCSFCSETWFWRFRQRSPERVIREMKDQISKYGVRRFWFVDSLANGNLKAFRQLVDLIIENNLDIKWNSYARNDGRMDRDFIFKIAQSGCTSLSYGVETGSQKVLNDMKKKIEVWEAEENLKNSYDAGIESHVNWMIGFPTENNLDFLHSMIFIWNNGKHIAAISPGMGCGPAAFSDLEVNWKTYGITWKEKPFDDTFLGHWYTEGLKNTALHRVIRIKLFAIMLDILRDRLNIAPHNGQSYDGIKSFYNFNCDIDKNDLSERINPLNNLNLNIFQGNNHFSDSVANEYLGIAWMLYSGLNKPFDLTIYFDPEVDFENFGAFIAVNYAAIIKITVDNQGNFDIIVDHELKHETVNNHWKQQFELERKIEDKSFNEKRNFTGNFKDLILDYSVLGETVHEQYRNKTKTIPIKTEA